MHITDCLCLQNVPRNMSGGVMEEEPHACQISFNVIEDIGLILKHVEGTFSLNTYAI